MVATNSSVIFGSFIMIAIIAFIGFLFLTAVFVFSRFRRIRLSIRISKFLADDKNDKMNVSQKDLRKLYPQIKEIWNKRADIFPIPEKTRLPRGWMMSKSGDVFRIRDRIVESFQKLSKYARNNYSDFQFKENQTVQQFMLSFAKDDEDKIELYNKYLCYYLEARFGKPDIEYDNDDYYEFREIYKTLKYSM